MMVSQSEHALFESAVYRSFPMHPIPVLGLGEKTTFEHYARELLSEKAWPEVIGYRLTDWDLDLPLSLWMKALPLDIFHYYLPSHLIFASILLHTAPDSLTYPMQVMDALILPFADDEASLQEIDKELYLESDILRDAEVRKNLYRRMSEEQRTCVAQYLTLYIQYRGAHFRQRGHELFMLNRDIWQNSSLQA